MSTTTLDILDGDQVLKAVYDNNLKAIRTNVEATVVASGAQEVEVSAASGDNIAISSQDGSRQADVTNANALKVDAVATGGATSTNQLAMIGAIAAIDAKVPTLGQQTMSTSQPVTLASDQTPIKTIQVFTKAFDSITASYPSSTQEIYQSRVGGVVGSIQETVTINYTDSTKSLILNLART